MAAGGLVRRTNGGATQIALAYHMTHKDWTFPKGKVEADDELDETARREVR